ncbi:thrombomodulin [Misgurnus anguillicaudatus]|uniref:thrombomodulin n=1 Tax=Misgurnus anguillicaudatus TaxID=75329 RepID=UPI003CCFD34A
MDFYSPAILFIMLISPCIGTVDRCACSKNLKICSRIHQMPVDFPRAREMCREQGGQLMTVRSKESDEIVGFLLDNMIGEFWIGLHLPEGTCSSNTSLLRGYEWTSGAQRTEFTNWASESMACSPLCVSVSSDRTWVGRSCREKLDGFLCESNRKNQCTGSGLSNVVILDNVHCRLSPCEHDCNPVSVGYTCSCRKGFRINEKDPRRCDFHCASTVCEALCLRDGTSCWCPAGFVRSEQNCEDIDECESNHGCAHLCQNTIGSYKCACLNPFILVNGTECTLTPSAFEGFQPTSTPDLVRTTPFSNYLAQGSMSTPGEFAGLFIFIVVAVFAVLVLVRYLRSRKNPVQECSVGPPGYAEFQESVSK